MRLLTFSSLYPNAAQPNHGIFVENRLRHLISDTGIESRVIAPVPWFPSRAPAFGKYATFATVPGEEERHGIRILHPRYPVVPKVGMTLAPWLLYLAMRPVLRRLIASGYCPDLIDAHFFYPDGVAAVMLGREFGLPVTVTARGSDIHFYPRHAVPRRMISWAGRNAASLIAVSQALKDGMVELGMDAGKIRVLRNGVDLDLFRPRDRRAARQDLGVEGRVLLSAGNLIPLKGHDLVIRALPLIPNATLLIVGQGPKRRALVRLARSVGVADRVRFLGTVPHARMAELYNAADLLVLASEREGWPNVLLEAMACGTPVVASAVWGIPEVVAAPAAGRLFAERRPEAVAQIIGDLLDGPPPCQETRAYAEGFDWRATSEGQLELFQSILERSRAGRRNGTQVTAAPLAPPR